MPKENNIAFPASAPFSMYIKYNESTAEDRTEGLEQHAHPDCEIYINLSGDVSFMVENRLYPVHPGSIIITRPYEYHHCVYHSDALHKHYFILLSCEGNEHLLPLFFERTVGEGNHIELSEEKTTELIGHAHALTFGKETQTTRLMHIYAMLSLLESGTKGEPETFLPRDDVDAVLNYIAKHFTEPITSADLAAVGNVSVSTLERHFTKRIGMPPFRYITEKRLFFAAELLRSERRVTEVCAESGFPDDSLFIRKFRDKFGMTPLQYKKAAGERRQGTGSR